jgi:hypothetical protein
MFSIAEMFLMVWALGATVVAVYFHHHYKRQAWQAHMAHVILVGLLSGATKMEKTSRGAKFTNQEDEDDEISIEIREG